ncbi:MAG: hypothetical protein LBH96_07145, partial [Candidatus Peribacteria bacterium]|nr:hypothetical protein [Candidatus Peribacteria bacterium]
FLLRCSKISQLFFEQNLLSKKSLSLLYSLSITYSAGERKQNKKTKRFSEIIKFNSPKFLPMRLIIQSVYSASVEIAEQHIKREI